MENNFRNVLIILSTIVIGAIFAHGLWTIRKEKNPYKLKTNKDKTDPVIQDVEDQSLDSNGFDKYGVGQIKVSPQVINNDEITIELENIAISDEVNHSEERAEEKPENPLIEDTLPLDTQEKSALFYQEPVTQAKPVETIVKKSPIQKKSKATLKRNQMEINFGEGMAVAEGKRVKNTDPALDPQIIILSVVMPANQQMSGATLLPSLLTLGMKYGDMDIFHRHQDNAGNGDVTFSLANMVNPGTFDLDSMETFVTQGISLFMTLPNAGDPFLIFEQMLGAAKQLAQEFGAQLLDDKRNVMTKQTEQHYVGKIREYDRQHRIASTK